MNNIDFNSKEAEARRIAFEEAARPLIKYLAENYHPHVTAIITGTSGELLEGLCNLGKVFDYLDPRD